MNYQAVTQLLTSGKALISTLKTWTQGAWAREEDGTPCNEFSRQATCFCSQGAIQRAYGDQNQSSSLEKGKAISFLIQAAEAELGKIGNIPHFNDSSSHQEVMRVWDKAIELAQEAAARN